MKAWVQKLNEICRKYPLKEKLLITDSHLMGEQIREALIKEGYQAVNLKTKTVIDLATELAELHSDTLINPVYPSVATQLVYTILRDLKMKDQLGYFNELEMTSSFSHSIYHTIRKIRLAGFTSETLPLDGFISSSKGKDLLAVLENYEERLESEELVDEADILRKASLYAKKDTNTVFILQSNLKSSYLEEQLLNRLISESVYRLPLAPVFGIHLPELPGLRSIEWGEPTPMSHIYDYGKLEGNANVSLFAARTEEIEAKNVLKQVKELKTKLDETAIYYTNYDPYAILFYHLCENMDIPVTFGEGLPISFSRPGRLISGLLNWILSNYSVQSFLDILHEGLLDFGEDGLSRGKITRILRELTIGWSQERYLVQIENEIMRMEEKITTSSEKGKRDYYEMKIQEMSWLRRFFGIVYRQLPPYGETVNYLQCLSGISYMLKNYCKTSSALDETAKTSLLEEIEKVRPYANENLSLFDAFEKIKDFLLSIRVQRSLPKPGHLHISHYKTGVYNSRPNVFIVGLDNKRFPGEATEDPLLLDRERNRLGNGLSITYNLGWENLYTMLQVLAESDGNIVVSYSNFDVNDNRPVNPAYLLLQLYRFITGDQNAEFQHIRNLPAPFVSNEIFEEKDYWNKKLFTTKERRLDKEIFSHFRNVSYGLESEQKRDESTFTDCDGLVEIDASVHDPRLNKDIFVTAGRLEVLAKCPYSYFLQEILELQPAEELRFDPYKWLDPASRGSLLHSIFETFYKQLSEEKEKPSYEFHAEKIKTIANRLIEKQKEMLPPPNERVFQKEVRDVLQCCEIFLKEEQEHCEDYEPLYFEYSFGIGDVEPAEIALPSEETVRVSGKIDRVDRAPSGRFHIIDYKTGSTYGYGSNQIFKGGRQLQHFIYALAIECHLHLEAGTVEESAYYFPTPKGLAQRFVREQNETVRKNGMEILEGLIDIVRNGTFAMTDSEEDCKFCDFKKVCRRSFYREDILEAKRMDPTHKGLRRFVGVRAYE